MRLRNPMGRMVHSLCFLTDNVSSIRYISALIRMLNGAPFWISEVTGTELGLANQEGETGKGHFPFIQNFRSNRLKCEWNARIKWKFPGINARPSQVLRFFRSNRLERKLSFHLLKISISTPRESARAYIKYLRHHNLPMRLQVFRLNGKKSLIRSYEVTNYNSIIIQL